MIAREQIKNYFIEAVTLSTKHPSDLKDTLLRGHPKLEGFIDRLTHQMRQAEIVLMGRGQVLKLKTIQDTVYDMTEVFMTGMEGEAKRRHESDMQKIMRQKEEDKKKEFDAVLAGKPEGEFAEAGVISDETIDQTRQAGNDKASIEEGFKKVTAETKK